MHWRLLVLLFAVAALFAQSPVPDSSLTTELWARPTQPISTATSKPGEVITLELLKDARDSADNVVMPRGARLYGLLTLVQSRSRNQEARLSIYIMRGEWKGGFATMNAFLAGPVYHPAEKERATLVGVDRSVVRLARGLLAKQSPRHAHIRVEGDPTCGIVYASQERDISLTTDVLIPLRDIPPRLLERAAR